MNLPYICLQTHKTFRIVIRTATSRTANRRFALVSKGDVFNSSCLIYKWKNMNWTFDVFILRLSAAICTQELTKLMTSTAVLPYFIHEANTKSSLHCTRIFLSFDNSCICTAINFNLDWISWAVTPCLWARISWRFEESCYRVFLWKLASYRIISRAATDVDSDEFLVLSRDVRPFRKKESKMSRRGHRIVYLGGEGDCVAGCILYLTLNSAFWTIM